MAKIHPSSIIEDGAQISSSATIGPFCIVGSKAVIGQDTELKSHVVIQGNTQIGNSNVIYPFASIGAAPQDLKYKGEDSKVIIGNNNIIREYVTIQPGTKGGGMITKIGNDSLFMIGCHIAHDCIVGNKAILANYTNLAGHVTLHDNVRMGGLSAIAQNLTVGAHAMIGGLTGVTSNVIPFAMVSCSHGAIEGLNLIGMTRGGYSKSDSLEAAQAVDMIFSQNDVFLRNIAKAKKEFSKNKIVKQILDFLEENENNKICLPRNRKK